MKIRRTSEVNGVKIEQSDNQNEFEESVVDEIAAILTVTPKEAFDILDAQYFYLAQAWAMGKNPKETADYILEKSAII